LVSPMGIKKGHLPLAAKNGLCGGLWVNIRFYRTSFNPVLSLLVARVQLSAPMVMSLPHFPHLIWINPFSMCPVKSNRLQQKHRNCIIFDISDFVQSSLGVALCSRASYMVICFDKSLCPSASHEFCRIRARSIQNPIDNDKTAYKGH
jgi:hypothetical protein